VPASPPFIEPCIPRVVRQPPKGQEWIHQPKLDGWRCQAVKIGPKVTLYSRHGHDLSRWFPTIAAAIAKLPVKSVTLDGELVQAGERGIDFYALVGKQTRNVSLMAFDILSLDGKDLRGIPLEERLAQLEMLLGLSKVPGIALVPSFDDGEKLMLAAMKHSLEGVVSKAFAAESGSDLHACSRPAPLWRLPVVFHLLIVGLSRLRAVEARVRQPICLSAILGPQGCLRVSVPDAG
jgi:bifunctional non-homologous end joining protein LigD